MNSRDQFNQQFGQRVVQVSVDATDGELTYTRGDVIGFQVDQDTILTSLEYDGVSMTSKVGTPLFQGYEAYGEITKIQVTSGAITLMKKSGIA